MAFLSLSLSCIFIFINADQNIHNSRAEATEKEDFEVKQPNILDKNISISFIRGLQAMVCRPVLSSAYLGKTLLEHSHSHSFLYQLWLMACYNAELLSCDTDNVAPKLKILTLSLCRKEFAGSQPVGMGNVILARVNTRNKISKNIILKGTVFEQRWQKRFTNLLNSEVDMKEPLSSAIKKV